MPSTLSKLYEAAADGSVERTIAVLSSGSIDIDGGYDDVGRNTLMVAAEEGHMRVVRVLLRHGANVSVANDNGVTALHISIGCRHLAVSKVLIQAGADLEARATCFTPEMGTIGGTRGCICHENWF